MARDPSVNATAPASRNRPISDKLFAAAAAGDGAVGQDGQAAGLLALGHAATAPSAGSSMAGWVSGRAASVVMPPAAAAIGGGGNGLTILETRLAQRGPHVDQSGAKDRAVRLDHRNAVGPAQRRAKILRSAHPAPADRPARQHRCRGCGRRENSVSGLIPSMAPRQHRPAPPYEPRPPSRPDP